MLPWLNKHLPQLRSVDLTAEEVRPTASFRSHPLPPHMHVVP